MVRERPILFSAPMVRALLAGSKTQTRRTRGLDRINKYPNGLMASSAEFVSRTGTVEFYHFTDTIPVLVRCPYGKAGDRLWVRETWAATDLTVTDRERPSVRYRASHDLGPLDRWRPSIHMPRWASRELLEITEVRVQRLQEISEEDAIAEGISKSDWESRDENGHPDGGDFTHRQAFSWLWDSIHGDHQGGNGWDANPWCWAITFRRAETGKAVAHG